MNYMDGALRVTLCPELNLALHQSLSAYWLYLPAFEIATIGNNIITL